jgi:hypothetical protein
MNGQPIRAEGYERSEESASLLRGQAAIRKLNDSGLLRILSEHPEPFVRMAAANRSVALPNP